MFAPRIAGTTAHLARTGLAYQQSPSHLARQAIGAARSSTGFHLQFIKPLSSDARSELKADLCSKPIEKSACSLRPTRLLSSTPYNPLGSPILNQTRFFSSSTLRSLRETYFRRPDGRSNSTGNGGSGGGGGRGRGWFDNFRRRLDALPPMYVVYGIIGTNVAIFLLWQYAQASWVSRAERMNRNLYSRCGDESGR
jgi:hypothetical protein